MILDTRFEPIRSTMTTNFNEKVNAIWDLADILRLPFGRAYYAEFTLPFMVLRRLECSLAPTKSELYEEYLRLKEILSPEDLAIALKETSGYRFYNISKYDLGSILTEPDNLRNNLLNYIEGFSLDVQDILKKFDITTSINLMEDKKVLYSFLERFLTIDLSPEKVSTIDMGYIFEELLRRFSEDNVKDAGEYYTPRSIVVLAERLAIMEDPRLKEKLNNQISILDPSCGTAGFLIEAEKDLLIHYPKTKDLIKLSGQELKDRPYAIAKAELLLRDQEASNVKQGNTLIEDRFEDQFFTYLLANPPYGSDWKTEESFVKNEAETLGFEGRFGAGLPPVSDGSLLFVQHIVSKMDPNGSRAAIVLNSSPLNNGDAGSGESEIRKYLLDNDLIDSVIALPTKMFYDTTIGTYILILDNNKTLVRQNKIQLIDARDIYTKMRKALGDKHNDISHQQIDQIIKLYHDFQENKNSKIFPIEEFKYHKVTVERPKRDEAGKVILDKKGKMTPDASLRDTEKIPYTESISDYIAKEVLPYAEDAYIDESKNKIGAEIPFDQKFYVYQGLASLAEIEVDLLASKERIESMLKGILGSL
jgi:type I restriction enzyme M protein